tara:strand:+ start:630 stop:1385 length:756 start_codon:yes stop_codon:yes gene_type:complete
MKDLKTIELNSAEISNLKYVDNVPEVVFIIWFGKNISDNRLAALNSLIDNIGVPYILITDDNYQSFILHNSPLHEAWNYLSGVHKADYLRCYILHHYGGGYHDIKFRDKDWINQWDSFNDKNIWIKSRKEKRKGWVAYDIDNPDSKWIQDQYNELGTMGWCICRPNTPYTSELIQKIHSKFDYHLINLKKNPSSKQEGYYANKPFDKINDIENNYPIRWLEILGELYHPLMYKYKEHLCFELPDVIYKKFK